MAISLSPETQKLLEQRMKESGLPTADDVVRLALQTLEQVQAEDYDDLDPAVREAIEEAEARERKMGKDKLAALPYRQTPLGELQALFSELSEFATDAQLWDLSDEDDDQGLGA